jgi:rubrerythrin
MLTHAFNDREGIRIAVEMERRGEEFYRRSARISKNPETVKALLQLAEDEALHRAEFERLLGGADVSGEAYDQETNAYLTAIAADVVFSGGLMALKRSGFDSPQGALLEAIQSEKDSILFYSELAEKAYDDKARRIFGEIIRQEKGHMRMLQMRLANIASEG